MLQKKKKKKESSPAPQFEASVLWRSAFYIVQLSHLYMTTGKTVALIIQTFVSKVMSLFYNMLSRFVIPFLPRSKCLLVSWLPSLATVILEPKKIKPVIASTFPPSGTGCHNLSFWMLSFKPAFSTLLFHPIKRLFSCSSLSAIQFSSVTQSCPTFCDSMDCSIPCFPVHHQLLELAQTHGHWDGDAIQWSHPLWSPSPRAFNLSQHQGLFQWVSSLHQWPKYWGFSFSIILPMNIQNWFPLGLTGLISLQS